MPLKRKIMYLIYVKVCKQISGILFTLLFTDMSIENKNNFDTNFPKRLHKILFELDKSIIKELNMLKH